MDISRRAILALLAAGRLPLAVKAENPVVGGTNLARARINSPDYVAGSTGWTINQDGSAEFNNLTIRGTFFGTDYIINSTGLFFYTPSEALGNLAISISPGGGTGPFGETVPAGIELYGTGGTARLLLSTKDASELAAGVLTTLINGAGGSRALTTILTSPDFVVSTQAELLLQSPSFDGTTSPSTAELLAAKIILNGAITGTTGTASTPSLITTDTWHTPTLGANFGNQTGSAKLSYQLSPENRVHLDGVVTLSAGWANPLFTIPAAYRPPGLVGFGIGSFGAALAAGAPYCSVTSAGLVQITNVPAASTAVVISGSYPLDIPIA